MQALIKTSSEMDKIFQIQEFSSQHQGSVESLVLPIQQLEFGVPITLEDQPDLMDIQGTFQVGNGNFWVAVLDGAVIGSIGVVDIGNHQLALKKMFVHRDYRGKSTGVAQALMDATKSWCKAHGITQIFLGTIDRMKAAHRFYEKNGFGEVKPSELPAQFPIVHVDTKFYRSDLEF